NCDLNDPESHLSQLRRYVRQTGVHLGWLTNGRQFTVWRFTDHEHPTRIIDLDIPTAIQEWTSAGPPALAPDRRQALADLFDLCRKSSFMDRERLKTEVAVSQEEWQKQALPLDARSGNERALVESVQLLVAELQRDARRVLDDYLRRYDDYIT